MSRMIDQQFHAGQASHTTHSSQYHTRRPLILRSSPLTNTSGSGFNLALLCDAQRTAMTSRLFWDGTSESTALLTEEASPRVMTISQYNSARVQVHVSRSNFLTQFRSMGYAGAPSHCISSRPEPNHKGCLFTPQYPAATADHYSFSCATSIAL
jgi:hypothetical protein